MAHIKTDPEESQYFQTEVVTVILEAIDVGLMVSQGLWKGLSSFAIIKFAKVEGPEYLCKHTTQTDINGILLLEVSNLLTYA